MSEIACLEEIKGRCLTINVCFPDTGPRMRSAVEALNEALNLAVKGPMQRKSLDDLIEELYDLREYLKFVIIEAPETKSEIQPTIECINYLMDPVQ